MVKWDIVLKSEKRLCITTVGLLSTVGVLMVDVYHALFIVVLSIGEEVCVSLLEGRSESPEVVLLDILLQIAPTKEEEKHKLKVSGNSNKDAIEPGNLIEDGWERLNDIIGYMGGADDQFLAASAGSHDALVVVSCHKPLDQKVDWSLVANVSLCYVKYLKDPIGEIIIFFIPFSETAAAMQVRLKAVSVLAALLGKKDAEHFAVMALYFSENKDLIIKCSEFLQASLREKPIKVLGLLDGGHTVDGDSNQELEKNVGAINRQMPDLIDTRDYDNLLEPNEHKSTLTNQTIGDMSLSSSSIDDLLGGYKPEAETQMTDLSLMCKPHCYSLLLQYVGGQQQNDQTQQFEELPACLEEERLKIKASEREFNLCLQFGNNAMVTSRHQLHSYMENQGQKYVLKKIILLQIPISTGEGSHPKNMIHALAKANWMLSAQSMSQATGEINQQHSHITSSKENEIGFGEKQNGTSVSVPYVILIARTSMNPDPYHILEDKDVLKGKEMSRPGKSTIILNYGLTCMLSRGFSNGLLRRIVAEVAGLLRKILSPSLHSKIICILEGHLGHTYVVGLVTSQLVKPYRDTPNDRRNSFNLL